MNYFFAGSLQSEIGLKPESNQKLDSEVLPTKKNMTSEKTFEDPTLDKEITVGLLFDEHKGIKSINVDMNAFLPYIYQL